MPCWRHWGLLSQPQLVPPLGRSFEGRDCLGESATWLSPPHIVLRSSEKAPFLRRRRRPLPLFRAHRPYYYRARYYDPIRSRFVSEDPIGFAGGLNPYQYAQGSPTGYADPEGLSPKPLPPGQTRPRECKSAERKVCESQCGSRGVQSCKVSQTWRLTRFKDGLAQWEWKDGPMSCSCNDDGDVCPTTLPRVTPEKLRDAWNQFNDYMQENTPAPSRQPNGSYPAPVPWGVPVFP
jgi:uncharacterized protein RhaS with RHS repeats